ncbi:unnamed protein product [Rotaria magnacalcarata]|uniref:Mos1 transposase HTH domain-containing protein n=1 Tax=Rotaria magnacalcarata TaxID=392030 RepID=A0A816DUS4_9BILA|nr:unnamed protein product [Rotaria magnacalcarata]CAF1640615.1 unnamed protein product [Rotaria magnacalcarata]CAF2074632.1 unnamed protein product [Rotaria magnacalcarata]CAF2103919.1 unnamed protein product [Rotaria magnacalcarata]CAF2249447.1 unnamed protein product [Rotaria magnacalcarata]
MSETFRQYIKIRTFLGYRPKEILVELQNAFGDEAPNYANIQRWSKRFRDAIDSPIGSPLTSRSNFETQDYQQFDGNNPSDDNDANQMEKQINANAKKSESTHNTNRTSKSKRSTTARSKSQRVINE